MSLPHCEPKYLMANQPLGALLLYSTASMTQVLSIIHQQNLRADVISHQKVKEIPEAYKEMYKGNANDFSYRQANLMIDNYSMITPVIYATTLFINHNLDPEIKSSLENTNIPIGKILEDREWEVHRKILDVSVMPADMNESYSVVLQDQKDRVVRKIYQISSQRQPICIIAEHFSVQYLENVNKPWS